MISAYHLVVARHAQARSGTRLPFLRLRGHAQHHTGCKILEPDNSIYTSDQGKCWYGLFATGRLLCAVAGGALSSFWIKHTGPRYSERCRTVQPQLPKATRMLETQPLRMQHQSGRNALRGFVRIQAVTENGMP